MTEPPRPPGEEPPNYPPPPAGGYPPPPGYPPPGYPPPGFPPPGYASNEDKTWVLVAHFGGAAGALLGAGVAGWLAPLVALLARGNVSPQVRAHAVAALNFQLLWTFVGVAGWITACLFIGWFAIIAAMLLGAIFGVIAGAKANEGGFYRYPMSISLIK